MSHEASHDNSYTRGIAQFVSGLTYDATWERERMFDVPQIIGQSENFKSKGHPMNPPAKSAIAELTPPANCASA